MVLLTVKRTKMRRMMVRCLQAPFDVLFSIQQHNIPMIGRLSTDEESSPAKGEKRKRDPEDEDEDDDDDDDEDD